MALDRGRVFPWYPLSGGEAAEYVIEVEDPPTDAADLREAIHEGMRITVEGGAKSGPDFSLAFLDPVIGEVKDLRISTWNPVTGVSCLSGAARLRSLEFEVGSSSETADLELLPQLEAFRGKITRTVGSVLRNANLKYLQVDGAIPKTSASVAGPLQLFVQQGARAQTVLPELSDASALKRLVRIGVNFFDLDQLDGMSNLTELTLSLCREVSGLSALSRLPRLSSLEFKGVGTRELWESIPNVPFGLMQELTPHPPKSVLANWRRLNWIAPLDAPSKQVEALVLDEAGDGDSWGVLLTRFDHLAEAVSVVDDAVASGLHGERFLLGIVAELRRGGAVLDPEPDSEGGLTAVYFSDRPQAALVFERAREALGSSVEAKSAYLRDGM
ncbi:hypothetical protein [Microbacterium maritypicum]